MTILLVILILVALIIIHELGHFIAAKISGVKVQEFGVGYPPRAFRFGKVGDTEYTLNWIPFGGFVRLFGDEGERERGRGAFVDAGRFKQAIILSAGVLMNVAPGYGLLVAAYGLGIPRPVDSPGPGVRLYISDVVPRSPAEAGGIRPGDELISMEDQNGIALEAPTPETVRDYVADRGGKRVTVSFKHNDIPTSVEVIPANAVIEGAAGRPALGIGLVFVSSAPLPPWEAAQAAGETTIYGLQSVAQNLWAILKGALMGAPNLRDIVGPVGLVSVVGEASQAGIAQVLALAGFISINLAVINLFPIPALDGGRLFILAVETLIRRPASKLAVHLLNMIGITAIILLMIVVTYQDIARLVA